MNYCSFKFLISILEEKFISLATERVERISFGIFAIISSAQEFEKLSVFSDFHNILLVSALENVMEFIKNYSAELKKLTFFISFNYFLIIIKLYINIFIIKIFPKKYQLI